MRYGLAIDNRRCIGCHACSVACKAENKVPLGVFRTWVRYVEKGRFPNTRRHFQVTRCNQCQHPPCVAICPVGAMRRRPDGIVDFDPASCMGCKACLQACPYDAIYVDPAAGTAAKCNFCAHRTELSLEPSCVVACPEHALVAGDLDDPGSEVSMLLARESCRVRRPEQGTAPSVFYVGAEEAAIEPGAARNVGAYMWASVNEPANRALDPLAAPAATTDAIVAYDVEHARPWDWQVPVYFFTKSISAGVLAVPALAALLRGVPLGADLGVTLSLVGLAFMALTVALLVSDLSKRGRFLKVLATPQPGSWLTRGAFLLVIYSALLAAYGLCSWLGAAGAARALLWPAVAGGLLASVYTAFLFGQCEGCDLWQTPLLPLHLVVQCVTAGAAAILLVPARFGATPRLDRAAMLALALGLALHWLAVTGELAVPHATDNGRRAARLITRGPLKTAFWLGAVVVGGIVPAALLAAGFASPLLAGLAGAASLAGLLAYEWCFVMAGQGVPNS
jgi:Fe-S-cluster-containing dehydrogenase component/formate-dependent nitrite reductase membrane component NrfD